MDISQLKTKPVHDKGAECRINGPDGKPTDLYITIAGIDSDLWRDIVRNAEKGRLKGEEVNDADMLAEASLNWRGLTNGGESVPFGVESAKDLYKNAPYIVTQLDIFAANRKNFLPPKSTKS